MNKIKLLLILPLLFVFTFFTTTHVFAQIPKGITTNPFFDMSKTVTTSFIPVGDTTPKDIIMPPIAKVTVQPKSFMDNVNVYIFAGNWEKLKTILPKDQSPIASFYLVFIDSKGKTVFPKNELTVKSFNNYVNTDTFFYPIAATGSIDITNSKKWPGHIMVNTQLPIQDSAFVVSANKILDKNDPSLTMTTQSGPQKNAGNKEASTNMQQFAILIVLLIIAFLIVFLMWRSNKKSPGAKN